MTGLMHLPPEAETAIAASKLLDREKVHARLLFDVIARAAEADQRCPTGDDFTNSGIPASSTLLTRLCEMGLLHVEVGGKNWRRVWVCVGPLRGRSTKARVPAVESYYIKGPGRP